MRTVSLGKSGIRRLILKGILPQRVQVDNHQTRSGTGGSHAVPVRTFLRIQQQKISKGALRDWLKRSPHKAEKWIAAAANCGLVPAQIVRGQLLLTGYASTAPDHFAAFSVFQAASESGDAEALNMLGRCYEQGWGTPIDAKRAIACFDTAAVKGHTWAQVNLAQMLMRSGNVDDRPRCFLLFKTAAEGGTLKANLKAMNSLARFYEEGWIAKTDPAAAAFWYSKAATLGDHWAQFNLATILFGQGDQRAAVLWLKRAIATSDNGFRRRIIPLLLARPEQALRECAFEALAYCADNGTPDDQYAYAEALYNDDTVLGDRLAAVKLFTAATMQGHRLAAMYLKRVSRSWKSQRVRAGARTVLDPAIRIYTTLKTITHRVETL